MATKKTDCEKSKIRTLLELLDREGNLDADELHQRTGYTKPLIAATMCCARERGMVEIKPRDAASTQAGRESERSSEKRKTRRGQIYTFVSYTSVPKTIQEYEFVDPWPAELRAALEGALMPGMRGLIAQLDQTAIQRRVQKWS